MLIQLAERKDLNWVREQTSLEAIAVRLKADLLTRYMPILSSGVIDGSSPPGAFVGHYGYPKVFVGPLIPPIKGDTKILDTPEMWFGKDIEQIVNFRFSLVRGKMPVNVHTATDPNRYLLDLHDLALSRSSVEVDAQFTKKPRMDIILSEDVQPFGPSATIETLKVAPSASEQKLERPYYDGDLKSIDGMIELYKNGVEVSRIQKVLSLGMLGVQKQRKIVPTRWSITAVDDSLSKHFLRAVKHNPPIDKFQVYTYNYWDNFYSILLSPDNWSFEWIEAFLPGSAWNEDGKIPAILGDYEPYQGRTTYAACGGCYYTVRLAVAETLHRMQRQASALILREARPGYLLPMGVSHIRESVRAALKTQPTIFDTFKAALTFACQQMRIPQQIWTMNSVMIREEQTQPRLNQFFA
jgi:hypothetical protein